MILTTAENKKKKEFLEADIWYRQRINDINEELKKLKTKEMYPSINMNKQSGHIERDTSDYLKNCERYNEQLEQTKADMMRKRMEIHNAINNLPVKYACVLEQRYLLNKPFHAIATSMNYSEPHIYLLHGQALEMLKI